MRTHRNRAGRPAVIALSLAVAAVGLVGCGSEETELKVAQARVSKAEREVARAQTAFDAASAQFCGASKDYIVAIDRYGDILNATAPTVGDVKTAGKDLAAPRGDVRTQAEEAVDAHEELVKAQNVLADAQAALVQAQGGTTAAPSPSPTDAAQQEEATLLPAATLDRVTVAENEFDAAQGAATDKTPLAQASQQFNAAVVALELAWLDVFADAGCLDEDTAHAQEAVAAYTASLQEALSAAGYYSGDIDGVYGPETVKAVEDLQKAHGLPVTGALDKATAGALQADLLSKGGAVAQRALANTAAVQQTLKLVGYWDGPVDGIWSPELTEAIKKFQKDLGVEPTGTVDAATVQAFEEAIAKAMEPPAPSPTPSPTPTPTPSVSPTPEPTSSPTDAGEE